MKTTSRLTSFLLTAWLVACGSAREQAQAVAPEPFLPWTLAFSEPAVLIADEIHVEGPAGLIEHFASLQDPDTTDFVTRTTPEGLLQQIDLKPGIGGVEIGAQLDAWELRALRRLVVLQRFAEVPITVRATGNAFFARADGSGEQRNQTLVFRGARGK